MVKRSRVERLEADAHGTMSVVTSPVIERTFAWISRNRRLARDFERYATTVAAFIRPP
jgi:hypothetical protein